jgi:hypothetical protein
VQIKAADTNLSTVRFVNHGRGFTHNKFSSLLALLRGVIITGSCIQVWYHCDWRTDHIRIDNE